MSCSRCADSVGARILGLRCSWWHSRQANDAVPSDQSIFSKNQDYKSFLRVAVNPYVPIFRGLDSHGGRKLQTDTLTHTHTGLLQKPSLHACAPRASHHLVATVSISITMHFLIVHYIH